jgi:general stress protein 26
MNEPLDRSALSLEKVVELARSIGTGMLVSHSPEGLRSRPMSVAEITDQGEIWFLTSMSSPKVAELTKDPHTLVVLAESSRYLSITGTATVLRDSVKARQLWSESNRVWFKSEDDPDLVLVRVDPQWAEYWDQSGLNGVKFAAKAAAAYLKGEPLRDTDDVRSHAKVRL